MDGATPYQPEMAAAWDAIVARSAGGTVLHSRRFLDYHGDRFRDVSLMAGQDTVFPLAQDPQEATRVLSHPGSSFGGVVTRHRAPAKSRAFLAAAARHLRAEGFQTLVYRAPPAAVLPQPDDGLLPHLVRLGRVVQMDLWAVLALPPRRKDGHFGQVKLRRGAEKGLSHRAPASPEDWAALHEVVAGRLARKYGRAPVHSLAELLDLHRRLGPQSVAMLVEDAAGVVQAGFWCIDYGNGTLHNQYNGATEEGLALGAARFGFAALVEQATARGFARFSFGRSTNPDGWTENEGLLRFKTDFGAGLSAQVHVEVPLDRLVGD